MKIHESLHENLKEKINNKKSKRQRNSRSTNESIENREETNVLDDFLALNRDKNEDEQSFLQLINKSGLSQKRVTCYCGFIAKNEHGLKIHQNIHTKNQTNKPNKLKPIDESQQETQSELSIVDRFGVILSKCKEAVPVVRIIQKSVRSAVSLELSKIIDQVITKNDENAWCRLLAFPYIVLRARMKTNKNGPNGIREPKGFGEINN